MSGGVDSSVAAALLARAGPRRRRRHDAAVGRRRATPAAARSPTSTTPAGSPQQLDIDHLVFNFGDDFDAHVVAPYVAAHARRASRPTRASSATATSSSPACCERAELLGFDAVATGHHARIVPRPDGALRVARGADRAEGPELRRAHARPARARAHAASRSASMTKAEVRAPRRRARSAHRGQARQPGRLLHHQRRRPRGVPRRRASRSRRAVVVDTAGHGVGEVDGGRAGHARPAPRPRARRRRPTARYVVDVDVARAVVTVGPARRPAHRRAAARSGVVPRRPAIRRRRLAERSAHGEPRGAARGHAALCGRPRNAGSLPGRDRVRRHVRHRAPWRRHRRVTPARQVRERPRSTTFRRRRSISAGSNPAAPSSRGSPARSSSLRRRWSP